VPRVERLNQAHPIHHFLSTNVELDGWLHDAALTADRAGTARVYVWVAEPIQVVGYFAILPHVVRRQDLPTTVGRGAPDVIPSVLLARLALAAHLHGGGHGGELLAAALETTLTAIEIGGGRVIVVDAIDDAAKGFYEHFGFRSVPGDERRLVMKASTAAASLSHPWP
jgi:GNAT superfamily N-acetyltransferase